MNQEPISHLSQNNSHKEQPPVAAFGNIGIVFRRQAPRCHWSPRLLTHVQMPCHQSQVLF